MRRKPTYPQPNRLLLTGLEKVATPLGSIRCFVAFSYKDATPFWDRPVLRDMKGPGIKQNVTRGSCYKSRGDQSIWPLPVRHWLVKLRQRPKPKPRHPQPTPVKWHLIQGPKLRPKPRRRRPQPSTNYQPPASPPFPSPAACASCRAQACSFLRYGPREG